MKNFILIISLFFFIQKTAQSQVFVGGGYVYSSLSQSGLDDVRGFGIDIQKELNYGETNWNFVPTLHLTVLNSNVFRQVNAFYANNFIFSPSVSYSLWKGNRISISPFASPFVGWLFAIRRSDLIFDAAYINSAIYGLEFGLEFKVRLYENLELKINPITLQIGDNDFRQGMISVLFKLSK
jgi:hypothetical protein